jgi:hypothetical protein
LAAGLRSWARRMALPVPTTPSEEGSLGGCGERISGMVVREPAKNLRH